MQTSCHCEHPLIRMCIKHCAIVTDNLDALLQHVIKLSIEVFRVMIETRLAFVYIKCLTTVLVGCC